MMVGLKAFASVYNVCGKEFERGIESENEAADSVICE